jgi:ankyrin repeat protein
MLAARGGHIETCRILLEAGADIDVESLVGINDVSIFYTNNVHPASPKLL